MNFEGFGTALDLARQQAAEENQSHHEESSSPSTTRRVLPPLPPDHIKASPSSTGKKQNQLVSPGRSHQYRSATKADPSLATQITDLIRRSVLNTDRILLVSSGTKTKSCQVDPAMKLSSFGQVMKLNIPQSFRKQALPASQFYAGPLHQALLGSIVQLSTEFDIEHKLVSPLYGLLAPEKAIVPYDCTYADKTYYIQVQMAIYNNTPFQLQQEILRSDIDVVILALSTSYQVVLDLISRQAIRHKTVYLLKMSSAGPKLVPVGIS